MVDADRRAVVAHLDDLAALTPGRTGNLSVRRDDRVAITPTGVAYDAIEAADVPVLSLDGDRLAGERDPSSEWPMHRRIYERFDAGAVVHAHSPWATTLAVLREPLPPVHYMVALAGERVPVADYATYGTPELADAAVDAMADAGATACLLANHGLVATGDDLADAVETARAVESVAQVYCRTRSIGDPVVLDGAEMERARAKFDDYGQGTDRDGGR